MNKFQELFSTLFGGESGLDWYTCSNCDGSGFYLAADHETEGYLEHSGRYEDSVTEENGYHNIRSIWCRDCRGLGCYHYNDDGFLIPGRGDEFGQPANGKVNYKEYMQSQEWRNRANIVKAHAGWRCQICHRHENDVTLDAHHNTYERLGHERLSDLICLCRDCHNLFETNKKRNGKASRR